MMNKVTMLVLLLLVSGCAGQQLVQLRGELHQKGHSEEYIDGYVDGCSSGYHQAGNTQFIFAKDISRYRSEPPYSQGWEEGHQKCMAEYESLEEVFSTLTSD